jgi:hypothetical protein
MNTEAEAKRIKIKGGGVGQKKDGSKEVRISKIYSLYGHTV